MTDWSHLPKGIDVSHYQGAPHWDVVLASGIEFALIKCADSGAIDAQFDRNRTALSNKVPWLPYAYLRPGDTDETIRIFCNAIGQRPMPIALDWEQKHVSATVVERWINGTQNYFGRSPLVYYGLFPPAPPTPAILRCPRWFPQYPGSATADSRIPPWDGMSAVPEWSRRWLIWQWTSAGSIAGVSGRHVDLDRLSCPIDVFKTWHATGTLPPAAAPALAAARPVAIDRTLSLHSTGDDVLALQQRLQALQFAVEADGVFGPKTQDAVAEFQVSHGLQADGIVGPVTRATLGAA